MCQMAYFLDLMVTAESHSVNWDSAWSNKVNRKVQGMPQSQTVANPWHQEEEKKDKNIHAQNKQTNVWEAQRPAPSSPSKVIRMLTQTEKVQKVNRKVQAMPQFFIRGWVH